MPRAVAVVEGIVTAPGGVADPLLFNPEPLNVWEPIELTSSGIVIDVNATQS